MPETKGMLISIFDDAVQTLRSMFSGAPAFYAPLSDGLTLEAARRFVLANRERGVRCPCCSRFAKVYKRPINKSMAHVLILLYHYFSDPDIDPEEWLHVPSFLAAQPFSARLLASIRGDWAKLKYWGLLEEKPEIRRDGSPRAGFWRITDRGRDFVLCRRVVPRYVRLYDEECVGFEGPMVSIQKALGTEFNYAELMAR